MKHGCPDGNKVKILQIFLVPHLTHQTPKGGGGDDVSEVWKTFRLTYMKCTFGDYLRYQHSFFKYCTLSTCKWNGITQRHTDGQIDKLTIQLLITIDAPGGSFRYIRIVTHNLSVIYIDFINTCNSNFKFFLI